MELCVEPFECYTIQNISYTEVWNAYLLLQLVRNGGDQVIYTRKALNVWGL